jgi:hypothetical protein
VPLLRAVEALCWEPTTRAAASRWVRWCEPARRGAVSRRVRWCEPAGCAAASRQDALLSAGKTYCYGPARCAAGLTWAVLLGLLRWVRIWAGRTGGGDRPALLLPWLAGAAVGIDQ